MAVKEYWDTIEVTPLQLSQMTSAQIQIKRSLENKNATISTIQSLLNDSSITAGIASLFLTGGAATIVGLASATAGVIGSYSTYNSHLITVLGDGIEGMADLVTRLFEIPKYDKFEIELPFIHFTDKNVRYVQGSGKVVRAHIKGGRWITTK